MEKGRNMSAFTWLDGVGPDNLAKMMHTGKLINVPMFIIYLFCLYYHYMYILQMMH